MRVKIGNRWHDSDHEPICIQMTAREQQQVVDMSASDAKDTIYAFLPSGWTLGQKDKWMKAWRKESTVASLAARKRVVLAREVIELRDQLAELNATLEQMEAEEGQEITDLKENLQASQQNEKNLMTRIKYLEARLVKAGERSRVQRNLEAQLQGEVNDLEGQVAAFRAERDALRSQAEGFS